MKPIVTVFLFAFCLQFVMAASSDHVYGKVNGISRVIQARQFPSWGTPVPRRPVVTRMHDGRAMHAAFDSTDPLSMAQDLTNDVIAFVNQEYAKLMKSVNLPSLEIIAGMFEQLCNGIDFKKYVMVLFKMLSMPVVIGIKALADVYHIIS